MLNTKKMLSWVMGQASRRDRKLQFSDRGDYGCSKFQFFPLISPKWGFFSLSFAILDENFPTAQNLGAAIAPCLPCYDSTDNADWFK